MDINVVVPITHDIMVGGIFAFIALLFSIVFLSCVVQEAYKTKITEQEETKRIESQGYPPYMRQDIEE